MNRSLKRSVNQVLGIFDIAMIRNSRLQQLEREQNSKADNFMELLRECEAGHDSQLITAMRGSKSQLGQDLFVLSQLDFKPGGYFIEFGAANGIDSSNTYLLEKEFGWTGILAEPATSWHRDLTNNRSCHIDKNCVWRQSNSVMNFIEPDDVGLSTIAAYRSSDSHHQSRKHAKTYEVNTISLQGLLDKYDAPKIIDYLSIDTEGSEYDILSSFDFSKYQFRTISCEHNFTPQREKIFSLLGEKGYRRTFQELSSFDDWYVLAG